MLVFMIPYVGSLTRTIPYLSPVLVRDGEDAHDGVAILLDEVVDVPREHGLSDHGNLQTFGHRASNVSITRRDFSNLYQTGNYPGHTRQWQCPGLSSTLAGREQQ